MPLIGEAHLIPKDLQDEFEKALKSKEYFGAFFSINIHQEEPVFGRPKLGITLIDFEGKETKF